MKRIGLIAALITTSAAAATAQQIQWVDPSAVTTPAQMRTEPAGKALDPAIPQLVQDPRRGHNDADARQCLQLAANNQIHRCAEKYRPQASRAKLVKTAQPADKAKTAEAAKPAESATGTSKSGGAATADSKAAATPSKAAETPKAAAQAKSAQPATAKGPAGQPEASKAAK
jgi:hypothetical protein